MYLILITSFGKLTGNVFISNILLSTYPSSIGILYFIISFAGGSYGLALSILLRIRYIYIGIRSSKGALYQV